MKLTVLTVDGPLFEGTADEILLPGVGGGLGVRAGHAPLVALLKQGEVVGINGQKREAIQTLSGTASITSQEVIVYV